MDFSIKALKSPFLIELWYRLWTNCPMTDKISQNIIYVNFNNLTIWDISHIMKRREFTYAECRFLS